MSTSPISGVENTSDNGGNVVDVSVVFHCNYVIHLPTAAEHVILATLENSRSIVGPEGGSLTEKNRAVDHINYLNH